MVSAFSGSGTFGQIYGDQNQAFGVGIQGIEVNVQDQSVINSWAGIGAGLRKQESDEIQLSFPSGTSVRPRGQRSGR